MSVRMIITGLLIVLFSHCLATASINVSSITDKAFDQQKKKKKYMATYFYKNHKDYKKIAAIIEKAGKKWIDVNFRSIKVTNPEEKEIVKQCGVTQVPYTMVTAPNGAITVRFSGIADMSSLERGFVSNKMAELLKAVQSENVVFLCFINKAAKYSDEVLATTKKAIEKLKGIAELVEIDPMDKRETFLLKQVNISPNIDIATTLVIAPTGIIVEKLVGKITERDLFDSFQKILNISSGCSSTTATGGSACDPSAGVSKSSSCK